MQFIPEYERVVLFLNKRSGSQKAAQLQTPQDYKLLHQVSNLTLVDLGLPSLYDKLQELANLLRQSTGMNLFLACGGDGTVSWVISLLIRFKLVLQNVVFAALPLGTGNDFARHLGWQRLSGMPLHEVLTEMQTRGRVDRIDVWRARIRVGEEGRFYFVRTVEGTKRVVEEVKKEEIRYFVNYLSFGMDARVSYWFERHRTGSGFCNLVCYGLIGLRGLLTAIPSIRDLVERVTCEGMEVELPGHHRHLLFLNIESYMAGVFNVWSRARMQRAMEGAADPQRSNDRKLELVSFRSELGLGLERVAGGNARGVHQGGGPYLVEFRERAGSQTYLQADGENMKLACPRDILIERAEVQLKVLFGR